ncbi:MAG: type I-A CRISPR-associated protein Cas7/Csa2 [Infirmifilum sp.]
MVYVSVRGRIWLQAEALNMVESVGNYVKHRKVPIMVKRGDKYVTFFVPAVSGEAVAHAYQVVLAEELVKSGDSVCPLCRRGIFLKSTNKEVYAVTTGSQPPSVGQKAGGKGKKSSEELLAAAKTIEESIIRSCGVEDIGGFLYAEEPNVKRTSSFYTGYMIPVHEVVDLAAVDPQLHSRYALGTKFVSVEEGATGQAAGQMIYYVELSSALFTFAMDLDTSLIGKYTFVTSEYGKPVAGVDPVRRAKAAVNALAKFLIEFPVGAKRTRFNPSEIRWESIAIAVADDVFTLPSSFTADYISRAAVKKQYTGSKVDIYAYAETPQQVSGITFKSNPEEAVKTAVEAAVSRIK